MLYVDIHSLTYPKINPITTEDNPCVVEDAKHVIIHLVSRTHSFKVFQYFDLLQNIASFFKVGVDYKNMVYETCRNHPYGV